MTTMVCCCLLYLFCFILPGLPRAADQVVCKQFRAVQAGHWTGSFHLPAKHNQTACRPFNPLHVPSILFLTPTQTPEYSDLFTLDITQSYIVLVLDAYCLRRNG